MTSQIDINMVKDIYQKMSNEELTRVATEDSHGLTPEAQEVVKEEIIKRNLDTKIVNALQAQNKSYTVEELDKYCEIIQNLPCPITGSTSEKLNATLTAEVTSFILFTQYKKKIIVGTPDTLDKANNEALTISALAGWWGIPWGVIRTINAIIINIKSKKTNRDINPNDFLRSFVLSRIGEIERYQDNKEMLHQIISKK